jgi:DNA-directed RNA polymerase specialized sigma24 family protein
MTHRATKASKIILTKDERDYLERLVRRRKVSRGEAQRAEIVLRAADGLNNREISDDLGVHPTHLTNYRTIPNRAM